MGELTLAEVEFRRADETFSAHPAAVMGLGRVKIARGDLRGARQILQPLFDKTGAPAIAAELGDIYARLGDTSASERYYRIAEAGWTFDAPHPALLARFMAERNRNIPEAVRMAEEAARERRDILTEDAVAWAYFKAGRVEDARAASRRALRTGTRDRRILYHAAAIAEAAGEEAEARRLVVRSLEGHPFFDLIAAPAAEELRARLGRHGRTPGTPAAPASPARRVGR